MHIFSAQDPIANALVSQCPSGSQAVFLLQRNATVGKQIRALPTAAFADCSDHCAVSNDCVGVEFISGNCKVFGAGKEQPTPGAKVLMKNCVKSERVCSSPFHFDLFEQKILVGFAREVVPAENIQVCMSACLNSFDTFGFECESAMFYPVDQECILNTEDRLDSPPPETGDNFECKSVMYYYNEQECILNAETRHSKPDLFIPEGDEFQVDYFDITCHLKPEKCPAGTHLKVLITRNTIH
ncbi:PAN domain protein [Teladorsagia circumcincta]|uniref:PAN domain protein n=1 Tax=Teladorsagia circumcincta TaxID=45464 RepID=A0A2G9UAM5_TELCI|nr:PAN domain protein [Teladorsagia circumcincta]